jgi:hypothetical protein
MGVYDMAVGKKVVSAFRPSDVIVLFNYTFKYHYQSTA